MSLSSEGVTYSKESVGVEGVISSICSFDDVLESVNRGMLESGIVRRGIDIFLFRGQSSSSTSIPFRLGERGMAVQESILANSKY